MVSRLAPSLATFLLATACAASPTPTPPPPAFTWAIYNRTQATVAVGPVMGLAPCASARVAADQMPGSGATVMPGAIGVHVGFKTPRGYSGVLSVVVAADGTHVYLSDIDPASLPPCQGQPQP